MAEIVDNSPELDLADPKTLETLANLGKPAKEPVKDKGVKAADVSPASAKVEKTDEGEKDAEAETDVELRAQVKGLKAELARRSGNAERVGKLESELEDVQAQLKAKRPDDPLHDAISKLDDKALSEKQTDWDDELADARARYVRAEENGDAAVLDKAAKRIQYARQVISAMREEVLSRSDRKQKESERQRAEVDTIGTELGDMYDAVNEAFPDFQDPETELWKAGDAEFRAHPALMSKMGPAGEIVAAALAIAKLGKSVSKDEAATRREVLSTIDKGLGKALAKGAASPTTGRQVDFGGLDNAEKLTAFNAYIDKIKGG